MPGYQEDVFIDLSEEEKEPFRCCICYLILRDAMRCHNGHLFCGDCITRWTCSHNEAANCCPTCRTPANVDTSQSDPDPQTDSISSHAVNMEAYSIAYALRHTLSLQRVACVESAADGVCTWTGVLSEYDRHRQEIHGLSKPLESPLYRQLTDSSSVSPITTTRRSNSRSNGTTEEDQQKLSRIKQGMDEMTNKISDLLLNISTTKVEFNRLVSDSDGWSRPKYTSILEEERFSWAKKILEKDKTISPNDSKAGANVTSSGERSRSLNSTKISSVGKTSRQDGKLKNKSDLSEMNSLSIDSDFKNMHLNSKEHIARKGIKTKSKQNLKRQETKFSDTKKFPCWNNNTSVEPSRRETLSATAKYDIGINSSRSIAEKLSRNAKKDKTATRQCEVDVRMSLPVRSLERPPMKFSVTKKQLHTDVYSNTPPMTWKPRGKENTPRDLSRNPTPVMSSSSVIGRNRGRNVTLTSSRTTPNVTASLRSKRATPSTFTASKTTPSSTPVLGVVGSAPLHPASNIPRYTPVLSGSTKSWGRKANFSISTPTYHSQSAHLSSSNSDTLSSKSKLRLISRLPVRKL